MTGTIRKLEENTFGATIEIYEDHGNHQTHSHTVEIYEFDVSELKENLRAFYDDLLTQDGGRFDVKLEDSSVDIAKLNAYSKNRLWIVENDFNYERSFHETKQEAIDWAMDHSYA